MKHLFVPYELALLAKEKGFNEECLAYYNSMPDHRNATLIIEKETEITKIVRTKGDILLIPTPLYQQLVDWFREEHGIKICEKSTGGWAIWREATKKQWLSDIWRATINETLEQAFKLIPSFPVS